MEQILKHVDSDLISNTKPFMYTEFPHKRTWSNEFGDKEYRQVLQSLPISAPSMLYVHIPYCEELCWFCTCHMIITRDYGRVRRYLNLLYKEINLLADFFRKNGLTVDFQEVHFGGGSPTYIDEAEFEEFLLVLQRIIAIDHLSEFSIEIDPRRVNLERMRYYHSKGINRVSFGIQDFDPRVQTAINRVQPAQLTEKLLTPEIRRLFSRGINFDLICGLPWQTPQTISETCRKAVELGPDRICLNYLHFAPEYTKHQRLMADGSHARPDRLPDGYERKELFLAAMEVLKDGGYVRVGYDHFAKSTDKVVRAWQEDTMSWNALGVTPGRYLETIGIGVSSMSNINNCYAQNVYKEDEYEKLLSQGCFPVLRGHRLNQDDILRREIIQKIRTYFYIDFGQVERKYGLDFRSYFQKEIRKLEPFIADGLVRLTDGDLTVTEMGYQFANVICTCFDSYFAPIITPETK